MCLFFSWKEFKTSKYVSWKILGKSNLCIFFFFFFLVTILATDKTSALKEILKGVRSGGREMAQWKAIAGIPNDPS